MYPPYIFYYCVYIILPESNILCIITNSALGTMNKKGTGGELSMQILDVSLRQRVLQMICKITHKINMCCSEMLLPPGILLTRCSLTSIIMRKAPVTIYLQSEVFTYLLLQFAGTYNLIHLKSFFQKHWNHVANSYKLF